MCFFSGVPAPLATTSRARWKSAGPKLKSLNAMVAPDPQRLQGQVLQHSLGCHNEIAQHKQVTADLSKEN